MEEECYRLPWEYKHQQIFFKQQAGSAVSCQERTMKKTFFHALDYTALFTVEIEKDDSNYIDQCENVLLVPGQKYCGEVDTTMLRFEVFKYICVVSRAKEKSENEGSFE